MTNVKRLTVIALCMASCMGVAAQNGTSTQIPGSSEQPADSLPAQWAVSYTHLTLPTTERV